MQEGKRKRAIQTSVKGLVIRAERELVHSGAQSLFLSAGSSENVFNFGKMAKWNSSTVGVRPGCAFVVSHRVEQSDLRERWFCVHFHFSSGVKRLTMEGVWVYESIVLLPLSSFISRL